jgi:amidase
VTTRSMPRLFLSPFTTTALSAVALVALVATGRGDPGEDEALGARAMDAVAVPGPLEGAASRSRKKDPLVVRKRTFFQLQEATIDDVHRAIRKGHITCEGLIHLYLDRIARYSGRCTAYLDAAGDPKPPDLVMPSGKEIELGILTPIEHAGQVNAFLNLNIRGQRSETCLGACDTDPGMPDALETARALDATYGRRPDLDALPLYCIPIGIKDQVDTFDMRTTDGSIAAYADDRPPRDATAVAKLRAAGAIILGKTNMGEYAGGFGRSTYAGQTCNPFATERNGGSSSSGSAAAVSANLVMCALAEESLGSIREPAKKMGIVGFAQTRGLVSREGMYRANLLRERLGPHCRTVQDVARVLDVLKGYDPEDPITATSIGRIPDAPYASFADRTSLAGKRIGIIREFMVDFAPLYGGTPIDRDSIRVANEAIDALRAAGAEVVESINERDCALYFACGDPAIPDMKPSIQDVIDELLPVVEPSFVGPDGPAGTWPLASRLIPSFLLPAAFTRFIDYYVALFFDHALFPAAPTEPSVANVVNLRRLNDTPSGSFSEGQYTFDRYLRKRGDANIETSADLRDLDLTCTAAKLEAGTCVIPSGKAVAAYVEKLSSFPSNSGTSLDTPGEAAHLFRQQALREIVLQVMAANHLDALAYPYETVPQNIVTGVNAVTVPQVESRPNRGWNAFTDVSGLPDIVVPAGYTTEVYDRLPGTSGFAPADYVRREVTLPFGMCFHGRPFDEAGLLEIASAFEWATQQRHAPPDFTGKVPGEP